MTIEKMRRFQLIIIIIFFGVVNIRSQDDLMSLLGEDEETIEYATASFKTNRVINLQSLESLAGGVLDIKISHRFGFISGGISELFGLDRALIRIGADYGISNRLTVGFGRSNYEKTYDGFIKYKLLRQSTGARNMPLTISLFTSTAIKTTPFQNPDRENYLSSKLYYSFQAIIGRKISDGFTLQLSPTLVHRNLVRTTDESNDVYSLGLAGRLKLNKRTALNFEYIYVPKDQLAPGYRNSFSLGFDIETGGHVFQLHFTNSTSVVEKGFITETVGDWFDGDIHFGFNVSRVFTIKKSKLE